MSTEGPSCAFVSEVEYWPAESGIYWWERFAIGEVRRDFELLSTERFGTPRITLPWAHLQPEGERVAAPPLRAFEEVLDVVDDLGMTASVLLLPFRTGPLAWLPAWTLQPNSPSSTPVLAGQSLIRRAPRNIFGDSTLVRAQRRLVREVVAGFSGHPSISAWVIGDRPLFVAAGSESHLYGDWLGPIRDEAASSGDTVRHRISSQDLIQAAALPIEELRELHVRVEVVLDWLPSWHRSLDTAWIEFVAAYGQALSGRPVSIAGLDAASDRVESWLDGARRAGAAGCVAAALFDYADDLRRVPPYSLDPAMMVQGMVDRAHHLRPGAEAWREKANAGLSPVAEKPRSPDAPDPEVRERDPEGVARGWFGEYHT